MARTRSVDFLPQIFQTPVNKQFLAATLDTLTQEPKFKKTQGFIGRSVGPGVNPNDTYVVEPTAVLEEPVVLAPNASVPTAVLLVPVVLASNEFAPIATLLALVLKSKAL